MYSPSWIFSNKAFIPANAWGSSTLGLKVNLLKKTKNRQNRVYIHLESTVNVNRGPRFWFRQSICTPKQSPLALFSPHPSFSNTSRPPLITRISGWISVGMDTWHKGCVVLSLPWHVPKGVCSCPYSIVPRGRVAVNQLWYAVCLRDSSSSLGQLLELLFVKVLSYLETA